MKRFALAMSVCLAAAAVVQGAPIEVRSAVMTDQRNIWAEYTSADEFWADNKIRASHAWANTQDGATMRSLLKFALPDEPASLGMGHWDVTSATFSLYRRSGSGGSVNCLVHHVADDTWQGAKGSGAKVTWDTQPAFSATPLDTQPLTANGIRYQWDATDAFDLYGETSGGTLSLLVKLSETASQTLVFEDINYISKGQGPELNVQYTWVSEVPEPATLTMLGLGLTALSSRVLRRRRRD